MKKIISTILAFAMIITMVNIPVAIADTELVNITEDYSTYSSMDELENWYTVTSGTTSDVGIKNGGFEFTQVNSKPLKTNGTKNGTFAPVMNKILEEKIVDEENNTVITLKKLQGVYDIMIDFSFKAITPEAIDDITFGAEQYGLYIGAAETPTTKLDQSNSAINMRVRDTAVEIANAANSSNNKMSPKNQKYTDASVEKHSLKATVDTVNKTVSVMLDNDEKKVSSGSFMADIDYINAISINNMERFANGSYFRFEKIQVTGNESDASAATRAVVDSLPAKLADNPAQVTENIIMPEAIDGVTWTSSDEEVISADGVVTRGLMNREVVITATVDLENNGGVYTKDYTMTVLKAEGSSDYELITVEEDFTKYSSINDIPNFVYSDDTHASVSVEKGKGLVIEQHTSSPLNGTSVNGTQAPKIAHVVEGSFGEDEENRTAYRINRYSGKYRITMDFNVKSDEYTEKVDDVTITKPFYTFVFGRVSNTDSMTSAITETGMYFRMYSSSAAVLNSASASYNTFKPSGVSYTAEKDHQLVVEVDTNTQETTVNIDNHTSPAKGTVIEDGYINAINLRGMQRMLVGSHFIIKRIKFEQLEPDEETSLAMEALDELPDSLADDPYAVTENITLPEYENITWSTSDSRVIDETGVIARWYDDRDVVITAKYANNDIVLYKDYTLTVKALDSYYSKELMDKSGEDLSDVVASGDVTAGTVSVSSNGITVTKSVDGVENDKESEVFYADYRLYGEEVAYDSTAKASVSASDYSGMYDIGFKVTPQINGDMPIYAALGNNSNSFDKITALRITKDTLGVVYNGSEFRTVANGETSGNTYDVRFKIDTDDKKIWLFIDGKMVASDLTFTDVEFIDSLRVILDSNNKKGDRVVIDDIVVTEIEKNDIEAKNTIVKALEKVDASKITANPDAVESIKSLPAKAGNYEIVWSSNNSLINVETGDVFHGENDTEVVVTATITDGEVYAKKDFYLTVRAATDTDEQFDYYLSDLAEKITKQNSKDIRYDLNLPLTHNGLDIEWSSSKPEIIGANGVINKSAAITEAVDVTLTAKVTMGTLSTERNFDYTVSPRAYERVVYTGEGDAETITVNGVENIAVTRDSVTKIKFKQNGNGSIVLTDKNGSRIIQINVNNNTYNIAYGDTVSADYPISKGTAVNLDIMTMPDIDRVAVWAEGVRIIDYGKTIADAADLSSVTASGSVTIEETTVTTDEYGVLDINLANIGYFDVFTKNVIKGDVALVTDTVMDADVEWLSSNTSLVSNNGEVTLPDVYQFVNMTLTLTSNSDAGVKRVVTKKIAVACPEDRNLAKGAEVVSSVTEKPGYVMTYLTDGNLNTSFATSFVEDMPALTIDLGESEYFNSIYVNEDFATYDKSLKSYTVAYSADGQIWKTAKTGTISGIESTVIGFDTVNARYVKFTINECDADEVYFNELEVYLFVTGVELMKLDVDEVVLNLGYSVTEDIELPAKGQFGADFEWSSSHPDIISADGKVTRPSENTTVTLTLTAEYEGEVYSRTFSAYVPSKSNTGAKPVGGSSGGGGGGGGGYTGTSTEASELPGFVQTDINAGETIVDVKTDSVFKDMDSTHWAYENVKTLKELGIVDGDENGNFNPSGLVTREQFLKMLAEAIDVPTEFGNTQFADVDETAWYAPYVKAGVNAGLVNGISNDTFGVGTQILRQDMALMILRVLNSKSIQVNMSEEIFADDANISDYAKIAVYVVRSSGIIEGYENMFNPEASLTRAEAATVILKLLDVLQGDGE